MEVDDKEGEGDGRIMFIADPFGKAEEEELWEGAVHLFVYLIYNLFIFVEQGEREREREREEKWCGKKI